ncbi:DUF4912 domain-containing protein [Alicyclobacillus fastidiosus]|uniref:DUF4912 domain-containing protein n=1 Tax=Alicyclobacillus fastidiosus TaxID=392011 RepID=A0ABY6ZFM2_9BACL|nr:DUF4912 domain-containing protein [Alicyclobacillus fastidiosus]WAH41653.1 DUF4912 domain-containing protein [Alicyclobacillus fastidiosus]GMA63328.1 hypothetical protein GCM10025859_37680 [Alicyclobacillus fastidiosus]
MGKIDLYDDSWSRRTGRSRIVAMVKDPSTLFVYWEVDELSKRLLTNHFQSEWGTLPLFLCVYDVTNCWFDGYNAPLVAKHRVSHDADNWYLHQLMPQHNYVVHLSTTTFHDQLFCILSSNVVKLPPSKVGSLEPQVQFVSSHPRTWPEAVPAIEERYPYAAVFDGYHVHSPEGINE